MEVLHWANRQAFADSLQEQEGLTIVDAAVAILWYRHFSDVTTRKELSAEQVAELLHQLGLCNFQPALNAIVTKLDSSPYVHRPSRHLFTINYQKTRELNAKYLPLADVPPRPTITKHFISPLNIKTETSFEPMLRELVDEANYCYEMKLPNACAVLCRRLVESLLVKAFEVNDALAKITEGDRVKGLGAVIGQAKSGAWFKLDVATNELLDKVWAVGNDAAHSQFYRVKMKDLEPIVPLIDKAITDLLNQAKVCPAD